MKFARLSNGNSVAQSTSGDDVKDVIAYSFKEFVA
jgi:hypothetical protein